MSSRSSRASGDANKKWRIITVKKTISWWWFSFSSFISELYKSYLLSTFASPALSLIISRTEYYIKFDNKCAQKTLTFIQTKFWTFHNFQTFGKSLVASSHTCPSAPTTGWSWCSIIKGGVKGSALIYKEGEGPSPSLYIKKIRGGVLGKQGKYWIFSTEIMLQPEDDSIRSKRVIQIIYIVLKDVLSFAIVVIYAFFA